MSICAGKLILSGGVKYPTCDDCGLLLSLFLYGFPERLLGFGDTWAMGEAIGGVCLEMGGMLTWVGLNDSFTAMVHCATGCLSNETSRRHHERIRF